MIDTNPPAETLPWWQARSTWAAVCAVIANAALLLGVDTGLAGEIGEQGPDLILSIVASAGALWAYVERLMGRKTITR